MTIRFCDVFKVRSSNPVSKVDVVRAVPRRQEFSSQMQNVFGARPKENHAFEESEPTILIRLESCLFHRKKLQCRKNIGTKSSKEHQQAKR